MFLPLDTRNDHGRISKKERRRGAAVVELAVPLPFLSFIFLAWVDFARIIYYTIVIDNCCHNASIFGSQTYDNQNQQWIGNVQYWQGPSSQMISTEQAAADVDGTNLSPVLTASNVSVTAGQDANGNAINTVTIKFTFTTITRFPGLPSSITIERTSQVRVAPATPK
ncbi:MAG TPA: TadE family protein [Gemmataceae bacterium]|nr:TadE family protein [Gemmataceae bacterium]